jgi:hypothetical protein
VIRRMPSFIFGSTHNFSASGTSTTARISTPIATTPGPSRSTGRQVPFTSDPTDTSTGTRRSSPRSNRRTNTYISAIVNGNHVTPNEVHVPHNYPQSIHRQSNLPIYRDENLVFSSVSWKWKTNQGKALDKGLFFAVKDEMERPKSGVGKKGRRVNLEVLGTLLWSLLSFVYSS